MDSENEQPPTPPPLPPPPQVPAAQSSRKSGLKSERPSVYLASLEAAGPNFMDTAVCVAPFNTRPGPVWWFFYGTLTKPSILRHVLDLEHDNDPEYRPAKIVGYKLTTWGQYPALIDGPTGAEVTGFAYEVETVEQEEKLARYETDAYEEHPCRIEFTDGKEPAEAIGRTFMYAGDANALVEGRFDRALWQARMGIKLPEAWNVKSEEEKSS